MKSKDASRAVSEINHGIHRIETAYDKQEKTEDQEGSEIAFLKNWAEEIVKDNVPSKRQRLVAELQSAIDNEEYERAAQIRDRLRRMKH